MLKDTDVNKFFVRIKELNIFPDVEGKVIYIREVTQAGFKLSLTDDCRPLEKVYQLPPEANDSGWYDVTSLIMAANMLILPKYEKCVFDSQVAVEYRNVAVEGLEPLDEAAAVGQLCLLGAVNGRAISFMRQAYYVASVDDNGYILAYSGFCQPLDEWKKPVLKQKILRLVGTNRHLFPAKPIVDACNLAYHEDSDRASHYAAQIKEAAAASSTDTNAGTEVFTSSISRMQL